MKIFLWTRALHDLCYQQSKAGKSPYNFYWVLVGRKTQPKNKQPWRGKFRSTQSAYQDFIYMYKYLSLLNVLYYNHQEITTLKTKLSNFDWIIIWVSLTLYSKDTCFYVCCWRWHLKTLWQRKKLLLQDVFRAFQLKKCSFLSAE